MKLHYAGKPGEGWGWGVCSANLLREFARLAELTGPEAADAVFMPLGDHDFNPYSPQRWPQPTAGCSPTAAKAAPTSC